MFAIVSRGRKRGIKLVPHRFEDNRYHVQLGHSGPHIPITDYNDIPSYLANGYSLRMSDHPESHSPKLVRPQAIQGWEVLQTRRY